MRPATLVRAALGGACLVTPGSVLNVVGGDDRDDKATRLVTQVLGARLVLQAAADLVLGARTSGVDIAVDALHAASMVPVAVLWPDHRRSAVVSATAAAATAALDLGTRRPTPTPAVAP
jgi:hypothetical protein